MYRKKGMERIQDSLLQDLERATSNLKNNPNQLGGWKLNKPGDSTISSGYSTARVAKHYSPQYYVNDEQPLYQNDSIGRSYSHADSYTTEHDYAAINGRSSTASTVPKTPTSPLHEGSTRHLSPKPFSYTAGKVPTDNEEEDAISEKISMIDSLLDDLNSARRSYERSTATLPSKSHQPRNHSPRNASTASLDRQQHTNRVTFADSHTQVPNGMANGDSHPVKRVNFRDRADSDQVNLLIRDLEHNLHNTSSPSLSRNTNGIAANKSVPNMNGMQPKQSTPSPMQSAQVQPVSEYNRQLVNIHPQQVKMENNPVIQVPLTGCNTSNATRELDDLMASLSDFKLNQMKNQANKSNYVPIGRVQVPSNTQAKPVYSINELDSMIGNLEVDLNKHGVNITKGNCEACGRAIVGQVVAALGKTWHPEHFTCVQCQQELGDKNFFEREGLAYCEEDYHKLFSPKCNYCNKPIYDRCITALDKTWHPEHFFCAHCGKNFGDEGYHEKAGNAYCKEDFFKLFAPKCSGCANPIVDNYVTALGGQWHSDCFVCRDCKSPFTEGKTFFDFEGNPYCETHYHNKRGTLCASCHKPITGRCITAMFQKYHPEHFICSFCLKQLNKGTFKKHNEKPYCHSCFDKLFA